MECSERLSLHRLIRYPVWFRRSPVRRSAISVRSILTYVTNSAAPLVAPFKSSPKLLRRIAWRALAAASDARLENKNARALKSRPTMEAKLPQFPFTKSIQLVVVLTKP